MRAKVGDRLRMRGNTVGARDRIGEIIEVRGGQGAPPYLVRFSDGHETLLFPGPDCFVEPGATVAEPPGQSVGTAG